MNVRRSVGALILVAAVAWSVTGCDTVRIRTTLNKGNELYAAQRYEEAIVQYDKVLLTKGAVKHFEEAFA